MTDLRTAAQQALEALQNCANGEDDVLLTRDALANLRAALAEPVQEHDLSRCPKCNGPADNGHDREVPPNPYYCTKCMAEPVAWLRVIDEAMVTHHLGVADPADDYETAKRKMNNLLCMAQDIGTYFAKQAEPVQEPEPVAWMTVRLNVPIQTTARKDVADEWLKWGEVLPLYAAPLQRKENT